jgi:hypothetical protein
LLVVFGFGVALSLLAALASPLRRLRPADAR